ncbi:MAG: acetate--CoA ligase family protein [Acidobacteriia bacterium]|nr:acetate--CoA ligase family protein [Terriglobia bacterium]
MTLNLKQISQILQSSKDRGEIALLETEGMAILEAMGIEVPFHLFVKDTLEVAKADLSLFTGNRIVIKVISPLILHKSDVGGIAIVPNQLDAIVLTVGAMERKFRGEALVGFTLNQFVPYDSLLGNELLLGARWTDDFGPVITFGPGGIYAEFLANHFKPGSDVSIHSPGITAQDDLALVLQQPAVTQLITGSLRGQRPRVKLDQVTDVVRRFGELAATFMPELISECEINPLVITPRGLMALDILIKLGREPEEKTVDRPIRKLKNLLQPRSAAIIGVSEKLNPGHIILNNLIREGFDKEQIAVIKPGVQTIEGCRCYADVASMPQTVDVFILSIEAAQAPAVITEIIKRKRAESIILIPGGLEEKHGTVAIVSRMQEALKEARSSDWGGPVINGGNCLGITSRPGRYDTMFIPEYKLPVSKGPVSPVAILSQSGAFAVAEASKLQDINPKYSITVGNQMDLTLGDYLTYLKDDPEIEIFAVYVEGFRPLDGLRFLRAAAEITASGRTIIFYRAGRTTAGAHAAASHTASIAGDYAVTRQLAECGGVIVAETISDFEDLTRLFGYFRKKEVKGWRLGALSNAGFECVAIADNLGNFRLASFEAATVVRLQEIFKEARIDQVVDLHNPIDLTPMTGDLAYERAIRTVMEDAHVDAGIMGCVPLTAALNTLPSGPGHREDLLREDSIVMRMVRLNEELSKPWLVVIDSGPLYDPMAQLLVEQGIPTFRTADRALSLFNIVCREKMRTVARRHAPLAAVK